MNAPTEPHTTHSPGNIADDKITSMLRRIETAAPRPPAFGDLAGTTEPNRSERPNWVSLGAAASLVALGIGGLVVLGTRDASPVSEQPVSTISEIDGTAVPTDSLPTEEPSVGTEPIDVDASQVEPEPIGVGDPLIGAALQADSTPLFELDQPGWVKQYVYGTDELPLGDTDTNMVVLVGDGGPTFDQPFVSISVFDATGMDIESSGPTVDVDGVASAGTVWEVDPESGLGGPMVNLTVPLDGDLALRVNSVRLGWEETVAIAESVSIATLDQIELDAPAGFRQLPSEAPETWRSFSYQWGFDDGTGVPEPVVISTPTASEEIPQQASIEVIGSNLGPIGLAGRIGLEARENRVINGVDMAFRPMPDQPGTYWVDWLDGDWSYYVIGQNLDSEEQFFDLLASLRLTDVTTFSASGGAVSVIAGDQGQIVGEILGDLGFTAEQLDAASAVSVPTSRYHYEFELYLGVGCAASTVWTDADAVDDEAGRSAALAMVDEAVARPDSESGLPSAVGLDGLADQMRSDAAASVGEWGSNDCPLWSR